MNNPSHTTRTTLRRHRLMHHLDTLIMRRDAAILRLHSAEALAEDATTGDNPITVMFEVNEARTALQGITDEITTIKRELDQPNTYEDMALIMVTYPDGPQVFEYRDPGTPDEAAWFDVTAPMDSVSGSTLAEITSEPYTDANGNEQIRKYPYGRLYTQHELDKLLDAVEFGNFDSI